MDTINKSLLKKIHLPDKLVMFENTIEEGKEINKKNNLSHHKTKYGYNIINFILFFVILNALINQISSYYEIKIYLVKSTLSKIMDLNIISPISNSYFCKNSDCNSNLNNSHYISYSNILYVKENDVFDYFYIKLSSISSLKGLFKNCQNITSIEFINFDNFSKYDDTSEMFLNCSSLTSINFNNNNNNIFQNVIDMSYMFANCSSLTNLSLNFFITSKVKKMNSMFDSCKSLEEIKQNFDTKLVTDMGSMFCNCKTLDSLNISNFDITLVTNMNSMFKGCNKLTSIKFPDQSTPNLQNMGAMFQSCSSIVSLDLSKFDTSSVLFMNDLFHDCISLNSLNISNFKTEEVIKMNSMFENCNNLTEINLSHFYTPALRQVHNIFAGCTSVVSIDMSKFDTFQVTSFGSLFYNCNSLKSINSLGKFVTKMSSNMSHMFYNCSSSDNLDLSTFITEKVTDMNAMFKGCISLTSLNLESFTNELVENMAEMFYGCKNLSSIKLGKITTEKVKYMQGMFYECISFETLDLGFFNTSRVVNMNSMFYGCYPLTSINLSSFDTSEVTDMGFMFYGCSNLVELNISHFDTYNLKIIDSVFEGCNKIKSLSLENFFTDEIISMKSIFSGCTSLESLDLSAFDTQKVLYMDSLFYDCSSLIELNLENFTLTNIRSMASMFQGCISLISIIFPDITRLSVTNTSYMFASCASLANINLPNFDSRNVISMDYMFSDCSNLESIYFEGWNTKNVITMNYLFNGCSSLKDINLNNLETPKLESIKGMFYGCTSLEYIDLSLFNTSLVTNMDFLFYKAYSLKQIYFYEKSFYEKKEETEDEDEEKNIKYNISFLTSFNTSSCRSMRYMFSFCTELTSLDLSFFDTANVEDMGYMFANCINLTSVDLHNFEISKTTTMEKMFYNCKNISFINFEKLIEPNNYLVNMDDIFGVTPENMVFCLNQTQVPIMLNIIETNKTGCYVINCDDDVLDVRLKRVFEPKTEQTVCTKFCKDYLQLDYLFDCYEHCPNNTYEEYYLKDNPAIRATKDHKCMFLECQPEICTLEKVILEIKKCTMELYETPYNNTDEDKVAMIEDIKKQLHDFYIIKPMVFNDGIFSKIIYNDTYQLSLLSNKNMYKDLTYIDIQDCENLLKEKYGINANDELILFKMEYSTEEYKIPIIEYTVFTKDGLEELNISLCHNIKFKYYIPYVINSSLEYQYNPHSDYFNELCYEAPSDTNYDVIIYQRKKIFNEDKNSLCEKQCNYLGYENDKVICECPVKSEFNSYLIKDKKDLVYQFENIHFEKYNFGVLKCFEKVFTKENIKKNFASMVYLGIMAFNVLSGFIFCIRGYKILYIQTRLLLQSFQNIPSVKNKKKIDITKGKKTNIITTGNNPPNKIKNNKPEKKGGTLNINELGKKIGKGKLDKEKSNIGSSLMNSKNNLNSILGGNTLILNKNEEEEDDLQGHTLFITDMEINMLSYGEAQKKDKRGCFLIYFSFIKSRDILLCLFFRDFNTIFFKICFFFFVFGICLGINTVFITDEVIQKISDAEGKYKILDHIKYNIIPIIISGVAASVIKSIIALVAFTDTTIIEIKEIINLPNDQKTNQIMIRVTSKTTRFYIINFIFMCIFWVYAGSFCAVFQKTQLYLLINAGVSFLIVIILPFLYYSIPALLRRSALNGKDSRCLYKFSQFFELI